MILAGLAAVGETTVRQPQHVARGYEGLAASARSRKPWMPTCSPPVKKIIASYDPVAIDAYGTSLLRKSWKDIGHLWMANGILGRAEPLDIRELTVA